MKTVKIKQKPSYQIIQRGINSLIEEIGPRGTAEFFKFFYAGRGDSVKEFKQMWQGMGIEEIHREILGAKRRKEI